MTKARSEGTDSGKQRDIPGWLQGIGAILAVAVGVLAIILARDEEPAAEDVQASISSVTHTPVEGDQVLVSATGIVSGLAEGWNVYLVARPDSSQPVWWWDQFPA